MTNKAISRDEWRALTGFQKAVTIAATLLCLYVGWLVGSWWFMDKIQAVVDTFNVTAYFFALLGALATGVAGSMGCALLLAVGLRVTFTKQ